MTKEERKKIFKKYDGHCAYCGCTLDIKDMQVDHIEPKYLGGSDSLDNYNPSCRQCNFYKGTLSIEDFRERIEKTLVPNLKKNFDYRLAKKYGMVGEIDEKPVKFYFEGEQHGYNS